MTGQLGALRSLVFVGRPTGVEIYCGSFLAVVVRPCRMVSLWQGWLCLGQVVAETVPGLVVSCPIICVPERGVRIFAVAQTSLSSSDALQVLSKACNDYHCEPSHFDIDLGVMGTCRQVHNSQSPWLYLQRTLIQMAVRYRSVGILVYRTG